jgi:hypothetical protein
LVAFGSVLDDAPRMFHPCPSDSNCVYCKGSRPSVASADVVDAVYCISLQEAPDRYAAAQKLFHEFGMCRNVIFFRPTRGRCQAVAIWDSHRAIAKEALRRGFDRVLILEDDVRFLTSWSRCVTAARTALAKLPADWQGLYLGHWPIAAYFHGWGVLRTVSGTTHAYIAHRPLLEWMAATDPMDPYVPVERLIGSSIDAAFACRPGVYAVFPMKIVQTDFGNTRVMIDRGGKRLGLFDPGRYRMFVICGLMRPSQWLAAFLSPLHWLIMRKPRRKAVLAPEVQDEVRRLFDVRWYLSAYPDVAAAGLSPMHHFISGGSLEGRNPNAWFDTVWYTRTHLGSPPRDLTAFEHYVSRGRAAGLSPNAGATEAGPA